MSLKPLPDDVRAVLDPARGDLAAGSIIISGVCLCGHDWTDHHDTFSECEFFGSNEEGGLDAAGRAHCFRFVDQLEPDEERRAAWRAEVARAALRDRPAGT